jgi:hypothetical protein
MLAGDHMVQGGQLSLSTASRVQRKKPGRRPMRSRIRCRHGLSPASRSPTRNTTRPYGRRILDRLDADTRRARLMLATLLRGAGGAEASLPAREHQDRHLQRRRHRMWPKRPPGHHWNRYVARRRLTPASTPHAEEHADPREWQGFVRFQACGPLPSFETPRAVSPLHACPSHGLERRTSG